MKEQTNDTLTAKDEALKQISDQLIEIQKDRERGVKGYTVEEARKELEELL